MAPYVDFAINVTDFRLMNERLQENIAWIMYDN